MLNSLEEVRYDRFGKTVIFYINVIIILYSKHVCIVIAKKIRKRKKIMRENKYTPHVAADKYYATWSGDIFTVYLLYSLKEP